MAAQSFYGNSGPESPSGMKHSLFFPPDRLVPDEGILKADVVDKLYKLHRHSTEFKPC